MFKKIFIFISILVFIGIITIVGGLLYLYNNTKFDIEKIEYYNPPLTTQFFDRNNKLVANLFDKENRLYVPFSKIPGRLIEILVATEDTGFFEHKGFNPEAILRALIKDIKAGKKVEGASTITQQLVKMLYLSREKKIKRKIKELFIAVKVENSLSKEKILEIYLNQVYLGHGYYGIKTAAEGYFHKDLNQLSLKEMCMLISLPKAPSFYDPTRHYNQNIARANIILRRLKTLGWISNTEYKKAVFEKPKVYNSTLTRNQAPYIIDMAIKQLKDEYPDIKTAGYKIKLSIDLPTQKIAQQSIKWGYNRLRSEYDLNNSTLNGAMITLDSSTGDILSAVGGVDYAKSSFNRIIQSKRSIGSAVKPFVYQIALDLGYNPASKIADISRTYKIGGDSKDKDKFWKPKNYERNTLGFITLREALVHSRNLATINLTSMIGLDTVINGLYKFGFDKVPENMSIVLGSFGITPLKIAEEYTLFSNYGVKVEPRLILSLENDKKGLKVTYPIQKEELLPDYQAYLMVNILEDVVKKGTGRKAQMKEIQTAGKTGTTNNFRDGWWCGFTPDTTTIVWFGNDDNKPLGKKMSGGRVSAPVFKYFYTQYLKIHPERKRSFIVPKGIKYFYINGKKELFTELSPPPKRETSIPIF
jgi:penicillin-binding protein 1A